MSENGADVSWNDVGKVLEDERSSVEDIQTDLARNNKGNICQSIDNCMTVFQRDPLLKGAIRKNELSGKIDIVGNLGWERTSSSLTDTDVYQLHWYLEKEYGLKNERNINKAMNIAASENRYHPIREYLEQLVWDGKYRIGRLLPKYLGAEEDAYTREIMQLLMLAAIHRVYEPGCKYEIMVCLVGGQGAGKSTFFRFLAINDEWFSDDLKRMDDDNVYRKMQGHWIIEMSEMMATVNAKSIEDAPKQKEDFWNTINGNKVNINLLTDDDVKIVEDGSISLIVIHVPRADFNMRPVYVGENPYKGTYKRNHEGDYHATEHEIRGMIRDQNPEGNDNQIIEYYTMDDIDKETLRKYRQIFEIRNDGHVWNALDDKSFLEKLGGYRKDRKTGVEGLTLAGLLMFGTGQAIRERFDNVFMDYRNESQVTADIRWNDRITYDGTWENNLFNFFTKVTPKLTEDLKKPFKLEGGVQRIMNLYAISL